MRLSSLYIKKCFYGVFVAITICFFLKMFMDKEYNSVEAFFIITYGGIVSINTANILHILVLSLPFLMQLYFFTDVMSGELDIATVYIFMRSGNKNKWFNWKSAHIFVYTIMYYSIQMVTVFCFACACGYTIEDTKNCALLILNVLLLWTTANYVYIFLANILALRIKTYLAFLVAWFFYSPVLILTSNNNSSLVTKLLPSSQSFIAWHDSPLIGHIIQPYDSVSIPGFSIPFSILYCIIISVVIYITGKGIFKKIEFLYAKEV